MSGGFISDDTTPRPAYPVCIVVEDAPTAQAMQALVDPAHVYFMHPFGAKAGRRFRAIFVRWPTAVWFATRGAVHPGGPHKLQEDFQNWVRMELCLGLVRGGDFKYI